MTTNDNTVLSGERLETSRVYFDTQAFRAAGLNWQSRTWQSLMELSRRHVVRPVITEITIREVEARIVENLKEAEAAVAKNRSVLNQLGVVFEEEFQAQRLEHLIGLFRKFLQDARFVTIPIKLDIAKVIDAYFEKSPPFSEKKKSEFPDAIVLETLREWTAENYARLYIVSRDPDLISFASREPRFVHLGTLAEFLSLAQAHGDLLRTLELRISKDEDFRTNVETALSNLSPSPSPITLENVTFTDLDIDGVYLIGKEEDGLAVMLDMTADVTLDAWEPDYAAIADPHRDDTGDAMIHADVMDSVYFSIDANVLLQQEKDGTIRYEMGEWAIDPAGVDIDLPREFSRTKITLWR